MKPATLLLALSLGLNVALAVAWWSRASLAQPPDAPSVLVSPSENAPDPAHASSPPARRAPLWIGADSKDLPGQIERLRAAGMSRRELAALVMAAIRRSGDAMLFERYRDQPYWSANRPGGDDPQWRAAMLTRWRDQQKLISEYLLTPEFFGESDELVDSARQRYGDFPLETLRQLALVDSESQEKSLTASLAQSPTRPGESRYGAPARAMDLLESQRQVAIKALLSAEQYELYELRNSTTARRLRSRLELFRPTEAEYKALFALEKSRSAQPDQKPLTAEQARAQIAAALGPERTADYFALQQGGGDLARLVVRLNLPLSTLTAVNTVRDQAREQVKAVRDNPQLSSAERSAQLATLAREAQRQLTAALGERGYEAYTELKGDLTKAITQPTDGKH